jgi:outer membrane lipopolysaccharide assembly protein LptE/RlpB
MSARHITLCLAAAAVLTLSACGEKPQGMGGVKSDQPPYAGVGSSQYANKSWKAGDKTSWEQQLKARGQYGQNEYSRTAN